MDKGEIREALDTDAKGTGERDIEEMIQDTAFELGLNAQQALKADMFRVTYHQLSSDKNPNVDSDNLLRILWYVDTPVGVSLETRDDFNKVVTQSVRFGVPQWRSSKH